MALRRAIKDAAALVGREAHLQVLQRRRPSIVERNKIVVELDDGWATTLMREVIYSGYYEAAELALLRATLTPEDRYLEIGAGIGVLATAACEIVGDENVTAVEANPAMADVARHTANLNGHRPDIRSGVVLTASNGTVPFYIHPQFWASSLAQTEGATRVDIPAVGFADLLSETDATYLNMDVEGAEVDLLEPELPDSVRRVCLEVHPAVTGTRSVSDLIRGLLAQGFVYDIERGTSEVLYLER